MYEKNPSDDVQVMEDRVNAHEDEVPENNTISSNKKNQPAQPPLMKT